MRAKRGYFKRSSGDSSSFTLLSQEEKWMELARGSKIYSKQSSRSKLHMCTFRRIVRRLRSLTKCKKTQKWRHLRFPGRGGEPFNNGMVHKARARSMGYFSCSLSYSLPPRYPDDWCAVEIDHCPFLVVQGTKL